ncbi:rho guanine nucleotide exchange factor 12 isoform X2 [Periophthalmus magnuspinnatus]|uniref:rho guanine nucleotide exchange factor 12 isoform X2 n=1 Tax=Periophthalmus magnuspinnatus TaxID=409849 RepID=UPI0024363523|nr:rho guanine nucleotide exchange factor 12 isoform X2 [Periophthalmus magnuspinnatus]
MSGTQATLADRTPSILNKECLDRRPRTERPPVALKQDFDPTGLVQRCVIIQRDENGFGLTVSGDNPVFVQLVKEDGAAMRAGVQTGDRIIKVNGTLVTHSNHIEVVKLIKSGSYVALTVLGRPPGLPQIPLEDELSPLSPVSPVSTLHSPVLSGGGSASPLSLRSPLSCSLSPSSSIHSSPLTSLSPLPSLSPLASCPLEELQSDNRNSQSDPPLRADTQVEIQVTRTDNVDDGRLCPLVDMSLSSHRDSSIQNPVQSSGDTSCSPPEDSRLEGHSLGTTMDMEDALGQAGLAPPSPIHPQIIGAEDDDFEPGQLNGQCSSFQSIDQLKTRPAHLAVFLHHVVSQFDPAPLLCYLYADLHRLTSAKESRRFFIDFHSLFLDRAANLKVPVPESVAAELERRRVELLPEDLCKHYTQTIQDSLRSDLLKLLEDFRHKRSMGLTLAEDELSKLDQDQIIDQFSDPTRDQTTDQTREQQALEKECNCAEGILSKIDDVLIASQPSEEDKCLTVQYVIQTYMKHLGVKVKETRGLEHKRPRVNFLPKIPAKKKTIKAEKEGEEKVKKRFPNILPTPRRLSRVESTSVGKAMELNKQRSPKQLPQPSFTIPEQADSSSTVHIVSPSATPTSHSSASGHAPDPSGHESDCNASSLSPGPRLSEGLQSAKTPEGPSSPSSSQFDFSTSSVELQDEDQDALSRRIDPQSTGATADVLSEDDQGTEVELEEGAPTWQSAVSRDVLAALTSREIERQEVINELLYTERAHVHKLKVLDCVFYQRLNRDSILPAQDLRNIFSNLQEIIQLHAVLSEQMAAVRRRSEGPVVGSIGEDLLTWFSGAEEHRIKQAVALFCSNLPSALELIKTRQKKDQRFASFMQEAESNRLCRRLQLKDIIPVEMQRLTKYPLLLDNIAKYTDDVEERRKVKRAAECCKKILNHINQAVKEAENRQRLKEYQRRLDLSSLKPNENPVVLEVKNLDLTKKKLVHEGPLSWKLTKDKAIDMYTLLLEDIMVLLQKQDERLVLKLHGKNLTSAVDPKQVFSPVIRLSTVLVRPVATDHRSFFVLSMSDNVAQIYELTAQTISDQRTWQRLITQCADSLKARLHSRDAAVSQSEWVHKANEIISNGLDKTKESCVTSEEDQCSELPCAETSSPLSGGSCLEEQEHPEEQEVDEAELEAFLDGQLAERLDQESQDSPESPVQTSSHDLSISASKAEDALRTLSMLKQLLLNHMIRATEEDRHETMEDNHTEGTDPPTEDPPAEAFQMDTLVNLHRHDPPPSPCTEDTPLGTWSCAVSSDAPAESSEEPPRLWDQSSDTVEREAEAADQQHHNGFMVLDLCDGPEDSFEDDVGIDMSKLLSSSSQTGSAGPNLSRQLMTHLRLLQADLHYLKEVEQKYRQLQHSLSDTTTDSDDYTDSVI